MSEPEQDQGQDLVAPVNTTAEAAQHPEAMLAEAAALGPSKAIYKQEADGQRSFVESDTLPVTIYASPPFVGKLVLQECGVKFLGPVPDDPLFQYAELPSGWKKVASNHSMWSDLFDAKGRRRAQIYYKAAFYDRKAYMGVLSRYGWEHRYEDISAAVGGYVGAIVLDFADGRVLFSTAQICKQICEGLEWPSNLEVHAKTAVQWLNEHFPDWQNPALYW